MSSVESLKDEEENDFVDDDVSLMTQKIKTDGQLFSKLFLHFIRISAVYHHIFSNLIH